MCSKSLPFSLIAHFLLLAMRISLSIASDTISQGQSLSGNRTIVSKGGIFELGFFTPGNSQNYYIGIWYKMFPKQTIIWVANRETPVSDPATSQLKLTEEGNLVLLSHSKVLPVWSSNSTSSKSSMSNIAVLLDTGNLVLRNQSDPSAMVWQSFDHPTDTWLPNGWIGMNKVTGEYQSLTSWKNAGDPAPGPFTDTIDPSGINQFLFQWNNSKKYWSSGVWNGQSFGSLPGMSETNLYIYKFVDDDKRRCFTLNLSNSKILARNVLHSSGQVQQWMWYPDSPVWVMVWAQPVSPCDVYSVCGAFGICDQTRKPVCSCPNGFSPASTKDWELDGWSSGCARNTQLHCGDKNSTSGEKDGFLVMPNVRLPSDSVSLEATRAEECEAACLNNCSCTAYAYKSGCSIWKGDIKNLQKLSEGDNNAGTLHLRLAASDLMKNPTARAQITSSTSNHKKPNEKASGKGTDCSSNQQPQQLSTASNSNPVPSE